MPFTFFISSGEEKAPFVSRYAIIASAYVMLIGSFVPIPGATGGLEYAFTQFFGVFIIDPTLTLIMLLWRTTTYYLGVIVGAILLNIRKKR